MISEQQEIPITTSPVGHGSNPIDPSAQATVPELVRAHSGRTPDATALRWASESITYAELSSGARRISQRLRGLGLERDEAVALCMSRSPASVHAALGVMEAGAAYLPLDPAHPTGRLIATLEDAGVRIVLTDATHGPRFEGTDLSVFLVEDILGADIDRREPEESHPSWPALDDLAYVIYTSGSTGRPKGVEVTHRNLINLVRWHQAAFAVTSADRGSAIAGPAFDAVAWELWPYLAAGASVAIADEETRLSAEILREWLDAEQVTIAFMPTALAEQALALDWPAQATLRTLLTGADSLHIYPRPGLPFKLVNNYGPTECTVVATSGQIDPADADGRLPSIGRPIANVEVHLLDDERTPVAKGEVGELYIGGAGVARGYRNHPELTAERFVRDPWSVGDGRLYRTGDLARYREDGTLEFGGRVDAQVKIRGNRVEPEEVALSLNEHPSVQASVVLARTDPDAERHLVAFVVPRGSQTLSRTGLALFLRERLPEYMVPSEFVEVDAFPLTANGKVNRDELLASRDATTMLPATDGGAPYVAPTTTVERRIAELTCTLLEIEKVSVDDDFFLLGGHSLLATQLIARIRDSLGVEIPIRTIFEHPTVRELAQIVEDDLLEQLDASGVRAGG